MGGTGECREQEANGRLLYSSPATGTLFLGMVQCICPQMHDPPKFLANDHKGQKMVCGANSVIFLRAFILACS